MGTAQMGAACAGGINIPACVSAIANGSAACKEHYKKCTSRRLGGKKEKAPVAKKADRRLSFTNCVVAAVCAAAVAGACTAGWEVGACVAAIGAGSAMCKEHVKSCSLNRRLSGKKEKAPVAKKADRRFLHKLCLLQVVQQQSPVLVQLD